MIKIFSVLLVLISVNSYADVWEAPHNGVSNVMCFAQTQCNDGRVIECRVFAPCRWYVVPFEEVRCEGADEYGHPLFVALKCF